MCYFPSLLSAHHLQGSRICYSGMYYWFASRSHLFIPAVIYLSSNFFTLCKMCVQTNFSSVLALLPLLTVCGDVLYKEAYSHSQCFQLQRAWFNRMLLHSTASYFSFFIPWEQTPLYICCEVFGLLYKYSSPCYGLKFKWLWNFNFLDFFSWNLLHLYLCSLVQEKERH